MQYGSLATLNPCQEFVLHAINLIASGETAFRFLESFNGLLEQENWPLLKLLSWRSLQYEMLSSIKQETLC